MVPGRCPPIALNNAMLFPIRTAPFDLAREEEPGDVAGVRKRDEQQVHVLCLTSGGETEGGQQGDRLTALLEEDGAGMHSLEIREFRRGIAHDDPPQGTCSKYFIPSFTRTFCPGFIGVS